MLLLRRSIDEYMALIIEYLSGIVEYTMNQFRRIIDNDCRLPHFLHQSKISLKIKNPLIISGFFIDFVGVAGLFHDPEQGVIKAKAILTMFGFVFFYFHKPKQA